MIGQSVVIRPWRHGSVSLPVTKAGHLDIPYRGAVFAFIGVLAQGELESKHIEAFRDEPFLFDGVRPRPDAVKSGSGANG
ncbi:MAG: hypothetical protein M1294_04005 [Firmicutes bacterium]|uniref:Uncharacterized protein n=1 Tax=Sulfobacillus benefaciens TaxID=453960 RepID=A0A2T2X4F1_9FIRM|nr:hypothetical protein [Bacillota bacterium]MCL5013688.1 hypothetical protein [Bacillota bacterium]PSR29371.1 MAG: hypothetical protein C7B43_08485 [Sulfobacillus benefaciens]